VVQDAAEKYLFHQDCIRFGLHREQYLVPGRLIKLYLHLLLALVVKAPVLSSKALSISYKV
jgi:hypothetical protein